MAPFSPSFLSVWVPLPFDQAFTYHYDHGDVLPPGTLVEVPFGKRRVYGVVVGHPANVPASVKALKEIERVISPYSLSPWDLTFLSWVATYTFSPVGAVLKMALSAPQALDIPKGKRHPLVIPPLREQTHLTFNDQQQQAVHTLCTALSQETPKPLLLDGVTGSGKTEVYFQAMAEALSRGKNVLVLLPEIALTHQWLERFQHHFGGLPLIWNSAQTPAQRRNVWQAMALGQARVVVGARSALFVPFANLGLIVVDEEHDTSYKQEEGVLYHARDMAVMKGHLMKIPVILVSATPAIETLVNVQTHKYVPVHLTHRFGAARFPTVHIVDRRNRDKHLKHQWISPPLREALSKRLEVGEQSLLFLNRRGYAPLTLCEACGYRFQCPHCSTWLIDHRALHHLSCHHCGYQENYPSVCPNCHDEKTLRPCGPGIERIAEEVETLYPTARFSVMSSDTLESQATMEEEIHKILNRQVDIIIGTQLMAKGHHFPHLTLVGIVDADLGLAGGDFRASEKTFQLLHQVAGRCGRAEAPGEVLIQTHDPENPLMEALTTGDRDAFTAQEMQMRQAANMPPYARLVALILSADTEEVIEKQVFLMRRHAPTHADVVLYGPAPAPLFKIRNQFRWRFLLKAEKISMLQAYLQEWLSRNPLPSTVRLKIDVDPLSFL
jgi:primosomal protein N' (replication factor Y)